MKDNGVDALKVIRGDLLEKSATIFFGRNKQQHGRVSIHMIRPSILHREKVGKSSLDTHGVDGWGAKEVERGESLL
jgi:hypothetical protein